MINGVRVADFEMDKKEQAIENIKASIMDIEGLQGMDIMWMGEGVWKRACIFGNRIFYARACKCCPRLQHFDWSRSIRRRGI